MGMRSFDPVRVGELECEAWVTYYRRKWVRVLRAAFALTRESFGLSWPETLRGGWWVLRANQLWAPYPDNDPDGARRYMERFYRMIAAREGASFEPATTPTCTRCRPTPYAPRRGGVPWRCCTPTAGSTTGAIPPAR